MAQSALRRFLDPAALQQMTPESLRALLQPYAAYLEERGLPWTDDGAALDCGILAAVLIGSDEDTPKELIDDVYCIAEMATPAAMDDLLEALDAEAREALDLPSDPTPADVAVRVRRAMPELLVRKHAERQILAKRSFETFQSPSGDWHFRAPLPAQLEALVAEINNHLADIRRGRNAEVHIQERPDGIWFTIRHGEPCRREATLEGTNSSSIFFRPERYDVLRYDPDYGQLSMNAETKGLTELYRTAIGTHVFGDADRFARTHRYTLDPLALEQEASLICADIAGLESVHLTELRFLKGGHRRVDTIRSDDLFADLSDHEREYLKRARLCRATFTVKFFSEKKPRTVSVAPPNGANFVRDGDAVLIEEWMRRRGFALPPEELTDVAAQSAVGQS